jgi:hypothetical protein
MFSYATAIKPSKISPFQLSKPALARRDNSGKRPTIRGRPRIKNLLRNSQRAAQS